MSKFDHYFAKRIPCPKCKGLGKIPVQTATLWINPNLPADHLTQPGTTCPLCNGLRVVQQTATEDNGNGKA
jgi:hypothetical protein